MALTSPLGPGPASTTRLLLIRHAEVEARHQRTFGGRIDMGISTRGRAQAVALAGWLRHRPFDALYASPMKRVQQTLKPLLQNGAPSVVVLPGLREVDFGDWTGLGWEAVREKFGVSAWDWLECLERGDVPNGESGAAFRARVGPCLHEVLRRHRGQSAAIVCHGGVIRMMLSILLELPLPKTGAFEIDYASVTQVALLPRRTELQLLNFAPWRDLGA
jgi:broad specificity phosphatase PhoE